MYSPRLVDATQLVDLTLVEPDPAALIAFVDLDVLGVILFEIGAATRALVVVGFSLGLPAFGVELDSHLVDYLEIALTEIFFFVPAGFLVGRHAVHL